MEDQLTYDYTYMMADMVGEQGASEAEISELRPRMEEIHQDFLHKKDNDQIGFALLPFDEQTVREVQSVAAQVKREVNTLIVIGIGGSDLGTRALHQALNHTYYNLLPDQPHRLFFAGANTDPKELADLLDIVDLSTSAINVISKSGDTIEPMSTFIYLRDRLVETVGAEQAKKRIIVSTDAKNGSLRAIVEREGYRALAVPADVGGRFSVLSTVGLFPSAFVGIDIEQLLAGAQEMDERLTASPLEQNPAALFAQLQFLADTKRGQNISVFMPYAEGLRGIAHWYRQLWAESLGKKMSLRGSVVNTGQTPVASVGATDQHSQVQLYNEGPFDKVITFVRVEEFSRSAELPTNLEDLPELAYLSGVEFGDLITTEALATSIALARNGRPNGSFILPKIDEFNLGQLLYLLEVAVVYAGGLYQINAFDQPGVEAGKQAMYALIGRSEFKSARADLEKWLHPVKSYRA